MNNTEKEELWLNQALSGVKVLDMGWALVGGITGKHLADHGASVIRIESRKRLDITRMDRKLSFSAANGTDDKPSFCHYNTSKYDMTLDLKHPRAKDILEKLISWADVVTENFTPGTMTRLKMDYTYMSRINPDIIMLSGSVYGQTGPLAQTWGIDGTGSALSGRAELTGWPDREPIIPTVVPYGDHVLPVFNAIAIVAALEYKRLTGKGQYIDSSMFEVCMQQVIPALLEWQANNNLQTRDGNRSAVAAPHGIFPCIGDDRWCAIAVFTEDEWQSFCKVVGNPEWTKRPEFQTLHSRKLNEDELEKMVSDWTKQYTPEDIMNRMQASGVAAGVVQNAQDIVDRDIQLKHRGFLVPLEHPVIGNFGHPSPPYKLSKTKAQMHSAPCLGEHTEYVCTQILGMSDEVFLDYFLDDVFV